MLKCFGIVIPVNLLGQEKVEWGAAEAKSPIVLHLSQHHIQFETESLAGLLNWKLSECDK